MQKIYGLKFDDLERLAQILEELLQVHWTARESSFFGEYFVSGQLPDERISLRRNYVEGEGWSMKKFRAYPLLLNVNVATRERQEELEKLLQGNLEFEWKLIVERN